MTPTERKSLSTDLISRYNNQKVGGAFDIKEVTSTKSGKVIDAASIQGAQFQSQNGFVVGGEKLGTQFKDTQGNGGSSKELSLYIKGFSNMCYKK